MQKETIIFLHGIVGNKNAFQREMIQLNHEYYCIAYNFYNSAELGEANQLTLDRLVEQLYSIFEKGRVKKAHLCALSFGSIVSMAFASKYPDMVISMTFVGGYCCGVRSQFQANIVRLLEMRQKLEYNMWLNQCARLMNPNRELLNENSEAIFAKYAGELDPDMFEQVLRLNVEIDSPAILSQIQTPILWLMGEYDDLYKGTLTAIDQYNLNVVYKELTHAGHAAHFHNPYQFMSYFQSFLTKVQSKNLSGLVV